MRGREHSGKARDERTRNEEKQAERVRVIDGVWIDTG